MDEKLAELKVLQGTWQNAAKPSAFTRSLRALTLRTDLMFVCEVLKISPTYRRELP